MISFKWTLSLEQPANETDLSELQKCLVTAGVFLDLSWNGEAPQLTISISEKLLVKTVDHLHEVEPSDIVDGDSIAQPEDDVVKQKGRPKSVPKNDITLARVHHMRFMGVPARDIAEEIGVSRRTFYRRFEQIKYKNLDPDTPFSKHPPIYIYS